MRDCGRIMQPTRSSGGGFRRAESIRELYNHPPPPMTLFVKFLSSSSCRCACTSENVDLSGTERGCFSRVSQRACM